MAFDLYLFQLINQFAGRFWWLDNLAVFFARYFEFFLIFLIFWLLARNFKRYWPMVVQAALAVVLARLVIVEFIRLFWPRTRPFVENHVNLLFNYNPTVVSFPSGHAAFYFALAFVVYFYNKKAGVFFLIASFIISLSRVFAGVHWPSDILAGAVVGIVSAALVTLAFRKFFSAGEK